MCFAYLLPATVLASPTEGVDRSNFTEETPKRMQKTMSWGRNANLFLVSDVSIFVGNGKD